MAVGMLCVALKGTPRTIVQVLKEHGPLTIEALVQTTGYKEKEISSVITELIKLKLVAQNETGTYRASCLDEMKQIERVPFNNEIARKIQQTACTECWKKWTGQQMVLMNHFGLNPIDPQAQKFLFGAMESFFFGDGTPPMMIDTSLQGKIQH